MERAEKLSNTLKVPRSAQAKADPAEHEAFRSFPKKLEKLRETHPERSPRLSGGELVRRRSYRFPSHQRIPRVRTPPLRAPLLGER